MNETVGPQTAGPQTAGPHQTSINMCENQSQSINQHNKSMIIIERILQIIKHEYTLKISNIYTILQRDWFVNDV